MLGGDLQGFPNGRRLADDVIDISIQAVEGAAASGKLVDALATGDKVDANEDDFGAAFPYVALPNTTRPRGEPAAADQGRTTGSIPPGSGAGAGQHRSTGLRGRCAGRRPVQPAAGRCSSLGDRRAPMARSAGPAALSPPGRRCWFRRRGGASSAGPRRPAGPHVDS